MPIHSLLKRVVRQPANRLPGVPSPDSSAAFHHFITARHCSSLNKVPDQQCTMWRSRHMLGGSGCQDSRQNQERTGDGLEVRCSAVACAQVAADAGGDLPAAAARLPLPGGRLPLRCAPPADRRGPCAEGAPIPGVRWGFPPYLAKMTWWWRAVPGTAAWRNMCIFFCCSCQALCVFRKAAPLTRHDCKVAHHLQRLPHQAWRVLCSPGSLTSVVSCLRDGRCWPGTGAHVCRTATPVVTLIPESLKPYGAGAVQRRSLPVEAAGEPDHARARWQVRGTSF